MAGYRPPVGNCGHAAIVGQAAKCTPLKACWNKRSWLRDMCTNFTPTRKAPWVKEHFGVDLPTSDYPLEAYPGYAAPIVVKSHSSGRVACGLARFGLIPSWAKDAKISRHTYNARSETARENQATEMPGSNADTLSPSSTTSTSLTMNLAKLRGGKLNWLLKSPLALQACGKRGPTPALVNL